MPQVAIVMPKMSMTMTEGELLTWHVNVGDTIKLGDVVCDVATDKIDMEVEATAAGTVISLHGNPGDVLEVGAPLLMVDAESDDLLAGIFDAPAAAAVEVAPAAANLETAPSPAAASTPAAATAAVPPAIVNEGPILATPKARATAADLDVDLRTVPGTGSDGVIKHGDVQLVASSSASAERSIEARLKTRRAIARAIEASRDIPAFSMSFEFAAPTNLPSVAAERTAALVTAWARTLRAFPELHADWNNGDLTSFPEVKVAVSVMAAHGVVTPVVPVPAATDANFTAKLAGIIADAARNHVALEYLSASTTGFVEIDDSAVVGAAGILIRPQSLSIAVGGARQGAGGPVLTVVITADHRIADPADLQLLARRFAREVAA